MSELLPTRDGFGKALVEVGKMNDKVVVVSADLEDSTRSKWFAEQFPERAFSVGIAEQDMIGTAAGLSMNGFTVFANSFAVFGTNRAYDQLRLDVCYNNRDVKLVCSHAGLTVGEDGASAQSLEDIAIMRVLPNMKVICPADYNEAYKATIAMAQEFGPMYLRTSRAPMPQITKESDPFEIGRANVLREGKDVTIIACGVMVTEALAAAELLKKDNIDARIVNMHTIKPLDEEIIVQSAIKTGAIVTAEEHQIHGGLGSAVAEIVVTKALVPMEIIAVKDSFGESGTPEELLRQYHLKDVDIAAAAKRAIKRKSQAAQIR